MTPQRGEVWLTDLGAPVGREQRGRRPAVVVSDDILNHGPAGVVLLVPVTSARREIPWHVELDHPATGLDHVSYAKCEDVTSTSEDRLITRLGAIPGESMFEIERSLRFLLGL